LYIVCPILPNPKNGNVTILEDQTIAIYKCNIGFSLRGSEVRECDDGVWTGTEAECVSGMKFCMDVYRHVDIYILTYTHMVNFHGNKISS
jgi:hypothetical protein